MKTTAKTLSRRVLGAILALCMLVGLLPMTAFAAAPQVPYADWDGTTARWAKPEGYQRIRYHISLVKTDDGQRGTPVPIKDGKTTVTTENTYYDLSGAIANAGSGKYWFTVQSETGTVIGDPDSPTATVNWNNDLSAEIYSVTTYDSSIGAPSEVSWEDGGQNETAAVWTTVGGAQLYQFELYRNGALVHNPILQPQSTAGGNSVEYKVSGYVYNYGGEFQFRVRPIKDGFVGGWAESGTKMVVLNPVDTIKIENASLDVTVGQAPQFNAKVAESDLSYYHIIEGWEGSDGKMITSDNAMNDRIANKILLFEDGVTYEYFIIVTAYTGYMVSDASPVKLNGKTLDYSIPDKAADGDEIAGLPIGGGFHQAQLFDLYSATAGADGPAFVEIQNAAKSASSVSVTAKWDAGEATPIVCAAVYDASGRMVSMEKIENAQSTGTQAITLPLSGSLSGEQLTVKVFLWKDFSSLQPLAPFDEQTV